MRNAAPQIRSILLSIVVPVVLLAAASGQSAAAEKSSVLYKCVTPAGVISIQSEACPKGSTEAWRRDATPDPAMTPEQLAQADAKRQRDQQTVRELSEIVERKLQPQPAPGARRKPADEEAEPAAIADPCDQAQVFAASLRDKPWLALTEDQTRRLYGWVAEQCKTPARKD